MGKLGAGELMLILVIALVIFGPSKLPALGKMAGKAVGSFKHYVDSSEAWDLEEELSKPAKTAQSKAAPKAEAVTVPEECEPAAAEDTKAEETVQV